MFDEIQPERRYSRKQSWVGVVGSVPCFLLGVMFIARHQNFGWLIASASGFTLSIWMKRLVACWRDDTRKRLKNSNG